MTRPTKPFWQYDLKIEIPATEVAILVDALDGEKLSLRDRLGEHQLRRQLEEQEIKVELIADERWPDFQRDIETISTYLAELISGRELHVEVTPEGPSVTGWAILGRRGKSERLALDVGWNPDEQVVVDRGIDKREARQRWNELPEWVRGSLGNRMSSESE
jgi:hypothetical protein